MKRKLLLTLLIASCSVASAVGLAACDPENHEHIYSPKWSTDATYHWHDCLGCDETDGKGEHTFGDPVVVTPATCTAKGEQKYTCSVCGYEKTESITVSHSFEAVAVEEDKNYVAPTCYSLGQHTLKCKNCNEEKIEEIAMAEHSWSTDYHFSATQHFHYCTNEGCTATSDSETHGGFTDGEVVKEATCEEAGVKKIHCSACDYEGETEIPKKGHDYSGEWQINKPTTQAKGSAVKECLNDPSHKVTVELPKLSKNQAGYSFDASTGVYTCVVPHELGDITFTSQSAAVEEAIKTALAGQNSVIRTNINRYNVLVDQDGAQPSDVSILFERGNNYAHIKDDSEKLERFITLNEDGTLFPVLVRTIGDNNVTLVEYDNSATLDSLKGYGYGFTFMTAGEQYYGAGAIIDYLYTLGKQNLNKDFAEGIKTVDGKTVYYFSYGYVYRLPAVNYFDVVNVEFTLSGNFVDSATLNVKSYANVETAADPRIALSDPLLTKDENGHYLYDGKLLITGASQTENEDGTVTHEYTYPEAADGYVEATMYVDTDGTPRMRVKKGMAFTVLEDGTYRVNKGQEDAWKNSETYTVTQIATLPEGEELPTNPYNLEDFLINSFKLVIGTAVDQPAEGGGTTSVIQPTDQVIENGAEIELSALESLILCVTDIDPETYNPYFDELKVTLIDAYGEPVEAVGINDIQDGQIGYFFSKGNNGTEITKNYNLNIKSRVYGTWTLKITTKKTTFTAKLTVNSIAPSPIYAETYQFNDYTGKDAWSRSVTNASVYQGQELTFRAAVEHPAYESTKYTATVTNDKGENVTATCLKNGASDGIPQTTFTSDTVGVYTIRITSDKNDARYTELIVRVKEAPDVTEMLKGDFENQNKGYAVKLIPSAENALAGQAIIVKGFEYEESDFDLTNKTLSEGTERTVINYSYDSATRKFTCSYVSGAEGVFHGGELIPYHYGLELSTAYKLFLTYDNEFDSSKTEKVIIGGFDNALDINNKIITAKSFEEAEKLVANVSGKYRITATDQYTFIVVNGKQSDRQAFTSLELNLYAGDYIQVWNGISSSPVRLSIEVLETFKTIRVEGVALEDDSATVKIGETLTLEPVFTPANTTQTAVVWTSSNEAIATVNDQGVVTGVATGTVTITVTTSNGRYSDTIEITVTDPYALELGENTLSFTAPTWDVVYTFNGEADKTYVFEVKHNLSWGSGSINYNGVTYNYNGSTATKIVATANDNGKVALTVSQFSYGAPSVQIKIYELIPVSSVTLDKTEATIEGAGSITLVATVNPDNAANKAGTWTSSNEAVATVDDNGVVTSVGAGTAIITFTSSENSEIKASCTVTVTEVAPTSVTLDKSEHTLTMGTNDNVTLVATVAPENTLATSLVWTSEDETIATVSDKGVVTAQAAGTVTIKVTTSNNLTATCVITVVKIDAESVTLDKETADMYIGKTLKLSVTFAPENASDKTGVWTSSNEAIATVNDQGVVSALAEGTVTITFTSTDGSHTASCVITITEFLLQLGNNGGLDVERQSYNYYKFKGEANTRYMFTNPNRFTMYGVKADGTYDSAVRSTLVDGTTSTLFLTTDGEGVVSVCVYASRAMVLSLNVSKAIPVESVAVNLGDLEVYVGDTVNFTEYVTVSPDTASDKSFALTSSDTAIATVSGTSVTAVAGGTVTITVTSTDGAKTATVEITVNERTLTVGDNAATALANVNTLYTLSGAKPNTTYVLTNTEHETKKIKFTESGNATNVNRDGFIELTTDANGKVSVILSDMSYSGADITFNLNVALKPVAVTETLTTAGLTIANLFTLGGTLLLDETSFEVGHYYTVEVKNVVDVITLSVGMAKPGEFVTFMYSAGTRQISVACTENRTNVVFEVTDHGTVDPNTPEGATSITLNEDVTTSSDDYWNNPPIYSISLEAGTYNIYVGGEKLTEITLASDVVLGNYTDNEVAPFETSDGNIVIEAAGTYYVAAYADVTFKVVKAETTTPDPEPDPGPDTPTPPDNYTIYDLLNEGSNTIAGMNAYGQAIRSFKGEAGATYTITSAMSDGSRATMVKYDNVNQDTDSSVSGATIELTADQYGYIHFRVTAFAKGDAVVTITKVEA